jgi:hypothetical protein
MSSFSWASVVFVMPAMLVVAASPLVAMIRTTSP